jgi:hypothetical protein
VKDPSSATIPNAQVAITDVATGVTRGVTTDSAGLYTAPNLLPGTYEARVTATGFSTHVQKGITLTVGAQQVLDITMQVGGVNQTVEVTTEAPTVELTSSALSAVVNATTIRELPLNGRSWTDLAVLEPGVSQTTTHAGGGNRGYGSQVAISGARPQQNNYRLDGVSINDYANGGPGSVLGGNLGVDAIQEFSVLTSNYSAEYGRTSGGVVNAVTRSGTNQFHGSAYEFLRNSALDARNFFDGPQVPPFKRNQFGASAGAPIRKDRTFIFGDYEGIRQSLGTTAVSTVLSPAARTGNLSTGTVTVDPVIQKYLPLWPLPNGALIGKGDLGRFSFPSNRITTENFFTIRVDNKLSAKDSLFGTYVYDNTRSLGPNALDTILSSNQTKRQYVILGEDHVFSSSLVNALRVGYSRDRVDSGQNSTVLNPVVADLSLGGFPGLTSPSIYLPGGTTATSFGGKTGSVGMLYRWNSFQGYDDAFLTRGLHSVKFGVAFEREQFNFQDSTQPTGEYHFSTLANFLINKPKLLTSALPGFLTWRSLRQSIVGAYVQDDWRLRPNLTLNLGLRYEMATVPKDAQDKISNAYNLTDATPHLGDPFFLNPTRRNFEPRVGFSWDPFHTGKTAVRGGIGMFDVLPLLYEFVSMNGLSFPFFELGSVTTLKQGDFPTKGFTQLAAGSFQYETVERNPHRNYVMQWNLNVQHELTPNLAVLIGYAGSHGVHQPFRTDDADLVLPTLTSAGYVWPRPIGSGTVLNPNASSIRFLNWGGSSFFDALEVGITKKMSHGLQFQSSFTWGKSIDDDSGVIAGDTFSNAFPSPYWFDLRTVRALSDYNVPRTLVISGAWQVPSPKSASGPVAWATNGWQLGAVLKANDGVPITPTFGTDGDPLGLKSSDPWAFPDRLAGPGCATLINPGNPNNYIKTQCFAIPSAPTMAFWTANCDPTPPIGPKGAPLAVPFPQCFNLEGNVGRNIVPGPGLVNLDFSVFKNNPIKRISESFNVQFRAEVFNILNHANFQTPVVPNHTDIFDSTGAPTGSAGLLTSTTTMSRQIQFAIKLTW